MKKLALLGIVLMMSFALIGCGGEAELDPETTAAINEVVDKHNELLALVGDAEAAASENGWEEAPNHDADFGAALESVNELLVYTGEQLENPTEIPEEELADMSQGFDELIPIWQDYLDVLSQPYVAE